MVPIVCGVIGVVGLLFLLQSCCCRLFVGYIFSTGICVCRFIVFYWFIRGLFVFKTFEECSFLIPH